MRFTNKVLFIAGASGMAAATAKLAVTESARVFVVDRDPDALQSLMSAASGIEGCCADLTSEYEVGAAFAQCRKMFGDIHSVFHAAGLSGRRYGDGVLHECTLQGWEKTISNNATTCFLVCRAAIRYFLERAPASGAVRGTILNMTSVLAFSPEPHFFGAHAYASSKGAVISLTKAAAAAYASHGININAIAPSLVRTPMSGRAQGDDAILAFIESKQPLSGGILEPEDVARVATFLLSDDARYITGQIVSVDGGWTITSA